MNKLAILALSGAVTASLLAAPLASQEIIVSPTSYSVFVESVQADLNAQLGKVRFAGPWSSWQSTGATSVRFTAGADGRPENIATYRKSGSPRIDGIGRRAVSRLTSLAPLPRGAQDGQVIQANIIIASDDKQAARLAQRMARDEARRLASSESERAVLALTVGGSTQSRAN